MRFNDKKGITINKKPKKHVFNEIKTDLITKIFLGIERLNNCSFENSLISYIN